MQFDNAVGKNSPVLSVASSLIFVPEHEFVQLYKTKEIN